MFAKRQSALAAAAGNPPSPRAALSFAPVAAALKKPPVAVGVAGLAMLSAAALFITVLGDPRAGTPSATVALKRAPDAAAAPQVPTGMEAFAGEGMGFYADMAGQGIDPATGLPYAGAPMGEGAAGGVSVSAPRLTPSAPLPAAPIAGLAQPGPNGLLPVIAPDGRTPAQAYARPYRPNGQPRVALIVGGLGLNAVTTRAAIERLPAEVTLSFVPYADGLQGWIDLARASGHEVLLEVPMEPAGYPDNDPGPQTLLANGTAAEIETKMTWLLGRATGYFGVTNYLGDRFVASDAGMSAFTGILRQRGLAFLDDGSARRRGGAWSRASADRIVDETQTPAAVIAQLNALEASARANGQALGTGFSYPVTVEAAARWSAGLQARGVQLAPASAVATRGGR